jgi:hypothetical protein
MVLIRGQIRTHSWLLPRNPRWNRVQIGVAQERLGMRLELHQLERRLEHLRVRRPERQRYLPIVIW